MLPEESGLPQDLSQEPPTKPQDRSPLPKMQSKIENRKSKIYPPCPSVLSDTRIPISPNESRLPATVPLLMIIEITILSSLTEGAAGSFHFPFRRSVPQSVIWGIPCTVAWIIIPLFMVQRGHATIR